MSTSTSPTGPIARLVHSRAALWCVFVAVHGALMALGLGPLRASALFDVEIYRYWIDFGFANGTWPVLDYSWVYPVAALAPMLIAWWGSFGTVAGYLVAWCILVTALDALAIGVVLRHVPRHAAAQPDDLDATELNEEQLAAPRRTLLPAWFLLAFLVCLGVVAIGRIDAIAAPLATIALCFALRRPALAAGFATFGAWIKVFPAAVFLSLVLVARRTWPRVLAVGAGISALIAVFVIVQGGWANMFGFITGQSDRGLQLEATLGTPLVVGRAIAGLPVAQYNTEINTVEIPGRLSAEVAQYANVVLVALVLLVAVLVFLARRNPVQALPLGTLALTLAMIVGNKVGSPQFLCALAPAIAVALARPTAERYWRPMAVLALGLAAITQLIFPWNYNALQLSATFPIALLALRNLGLCVLLAWTMWRLVLAARRHRGREHAATSHGAHSQTAPATDPATD